MRVFDNRYTPVGAMVQLKRAALAGRFVGDKKQTAIDYIESCTGYHEPTLTHAIFYREEGTQRSVSGHRWMDRCFTLVLTFTDDKRQRVDYDPGRAWLWLSGLFGVDLDKAWMEKSTGAKNPRVFHVFCDEQWRPIHMPTKDIERELIRREWTPVEENTCIA